MTVRGVLGPNDPPANRNADRLAAKDHRSFASHVGRWRCHHGPAMRIEPLRRPPIAFAHHGASTTESPGSPEAFELALRLGATGLQSTLWATADGVPVLAPEATVRAGIRRHRVDRKDFADLPEQSITRAAAVAAMLGPDHHLLVSVGAVDAVETFIEVWDEVTSLGTPWLATEDLDLLAAWRDRWPELRLVNAVSLSSLRHGPERRAARLAELDIDAVQMPYPDWTGGLVTLFHRFEVEAFGWQAPHERMLDDLVRMGCDGIASTHVDRLNDAFVRAGLH